MGPLGQNFLLILISCDGSRMAYYVRILSIFSLLYNVHVLNDIGSLRCIAYLYALQILHI